MTAERRERAERRPALGGGPARRRDYCHPTLSIGYDSNA